MRKLAYKVVIDSIEPIDNADRLEVARIGGWRVVVGKGEFKAGDVVLYFEIDSALNVNDRRFDFLKDRCLRKFMAGPDTMIDQCYRIKSIKLRGVVSQGLIVSCESFYEVRSMPLGEDCSALLGVRHYDEVFEGTQKLLCKAVPADQKGMFPGFVPKTDEERIQNIPQAEIDAFSDSLFEVTEKRDGSSMTVFYAQRIRPEDPFGICSRNFELKPEMGSWWVPVEQLHLQNKLEMYCETHGCQLAFQGELVGPGINSNRDKLTELHWQIFRIWDIDNECWLECHERQKLCELLGLEHVPVLGYHKLSEFSCDRDKLLAFAEGKTASGNEREGLVWKTEDGRFHFKTVSNRYLLKQE